MNRGVSCMSLQTMESMVRWLDNHVLENPTLERMSSHVGYSPYYCSTKFREYTGVTYKRYLAKCRLGVAASLLLRTGDKVIEIALKCGYSSAESLARAFMEVYQCTPTQYRKAHIG